MCLPMTFVTSRLNYLFLYNVIYLGCTILSVVLVTDYDSSQFIHLTSDSLTKGGPEHFLKMDDLFFLIEGSDIFQLLLVLFLSTYQAKMCS